MSRGITSRRSATRRRSVVQDGRAMTLHRANISSVKTSIKKTNISLHSTGRQIQNVTYISERASKRATPSLKSVRVSGGAEERVVKVPRNSTIASCRAPSSAIFSLHCQSRQLPNKNVNELKPCCDKDEETLFNIQVARMTID
jgi:hypothetical protein